MDPFLLVCLAILILALYVYGKWKNEYFEKRNIKYIKPPFPFVGNIRKILTRKENFVQCMDKLYKSFPGESYIGFYEFIKPNILLRDVNLIRDIGIKHFDHFQDHRTYVDSEADPLFGNFLITLKGKKWKEMRTTLSPIFTKGKLKGMFQFMWTCGDQLNEYFLKELREETNENGVLEVDIKVAIKRYTLDIISTTAFGIESNSLKNHNNILYRYIDEISHMNIIHVVKFLMHSAFPKTMKFFGISIYKKKTIKFLNKLVHESIDYRMANDLSRVDMIELLKESRKLYKIKDESNLSTKNMAGNIRKWTDYELSAQAVLFFLGGFDSTSIITSSAIYELAVHEDTQRRLQQEIDEVMSDLDCITFDVLNNMKYMDMVVSETLRLHPPIGCIDRNCLNDFQIPKQYSENNTEYKIEKSQCVWIPIYSIQRDPNYFIDPDTFNPERFSDENKHLINAMAYMPFGLGPRQCIGIRYATIVIKMAIFQLLSKFDVVTTEKTPIPMVIDATSIIVKSKKGYWIGMKERKNV